MNRFGVLLSGCAIIALPATMTAQTASLEICNHGKISVNVAYAARIQLFFTGYRWVTEGWYSVDPGECKVVYNKDYSDAGPITPQSGARVVLVAKVGNTWRALPRDVSGTPDWMRPGTGQICADLNHEFTYQEAQGDPAAGCSTLTIPAAWDFLPPEPGDYTFGVSWDGSGSSVAGAGAQTAANKSITYFCASSGKRPVMYFSDVFEVPEARSDADNFITYQRVVLQFRILLAERYNFSDDTTDPVDCLHESTSANTVATVREQTRGLGSDAVANGRKVVQTGWKYAAAQPATDATADATREDVEELNASGRAALAQWVRKDVARYLAASKTGFNAYKSGDVQLQQGLRMWTSSEKPEAARGCWIVQGDSTTTLSCAIPVNAERERAYYVALSEDVAASLPASWSAEAPNPFGGSLPSTGFQSTSGAHGEIWLAETAEGGYEVHFQLVSAPVRH